MARSAALTAALAALGAAAGGAHACTTLAVTRGASADGGVYVAHTNDGEAPTDARLVKVPAADHAPGAMRPVFFTPESYPRYAGDARGVPEYAPRADLNQTAWEPIGHIPEVRHTYAYMEETYGAINEHQLGIAESTCSGVFGTSPAGQGGKALLSVDVLTQLAMERAAKARDAVALMGAAAEEYGFYGAGSFEGTAESLLVSDTEEAWIFHILPDPTGTSAIWAAQRVPDGEVAVVANAFIIREVDPDDEDNFQASASAFSVAQEKGWWSPSSGKKLDFTAIYSDGEYAHKYYSGRRVWGAYRLLAPSVDLPSEYGEYRKSRPYPVSLKPDAKVSVLDVLDVLRDHYEGTEYDMTEGLAAGPFGSPNRIAAGVGKGAGEAEVSGNWERSIALYRTTDSYVSVSRGDLGDAAGPVVWFAPGAAHGTVFVPLSPHMTRVPHAYSHGNPLEFDRTTATWGTKYVSNIMDLKWKYMVRDVAAAQHALEAVAGAAAVEAADQKCKGLALGSGALAACVDDVYGAHAEKANEAWWRLSDVLMFKYADGWVNELPKSADSTGYPAWWLHAVGYADGPPPVPQQQMASAPAVSAGVRRAGAAATY